MASSEFPLVKCTVAQSCEYEHKSLCIPWVVYAFVLGERKWEDQES